MCAHMCAPLMDTCGLVGRWMSRSGQRGKMNIVGGSAKNRPHTYLAQGKVRQKVTRKQA